MSDFILDLDYNDGKQKIEIGDHEEVTVTNGTVFFGYKFNYTVSNSNRSVSGWAHGTFFFNFRFCLLRCLDLQKAPHHQQRWASRMGLTQNQRLQLTQNYQQDGSQEDGPFQSRWSRHSFGNAWQSLPKHHSCKLLNSTSWGLQQVIHRLL